MKTFAALLIAFPLFGAHAYAAPKLELMCMPDGRSSQEGVTLTIKGDSASIIGPSDRVPMSGQLRRDANGRPVHAPANNRDSIVFDVASDGSQQLRVESSLLSPSRDGRGRRGLLMNFIAHSHATVWECAELK